MPASSTDMDCLSESCRYGLWKLALRRHRPIGQATSGWTVRKRGDRAIGLNPRCVDGVSRRCPTSAGYQIRSNALAPGRRDSSAQCHDQSWEWLVWIRVPRCQADVSCGSQPPTPISRVAALANGGNFTDGSMPFSPCASTDNERP
jgi:hypothetical protein